MEVNESYQKWSEHKSNSKTKKCLFQITKVSSLFLFLAFVTTRKLSLCDSCIATIWLEPSQ
jgi:hypothetical protein